MQQVLKSEASLNIVIYIPFLSLSSGHIKSRWSCEWPLIAGNVTAVRVKSGTKMHPNNSKTVTDISSSRLPFRQVLNFTNKLQELQRWTSLMSHISFCSECASLLFPPQSQNIFCHINNIQSNGEIGVIRLLVMASPTLPSQVPEQVSNLAPFQAHPLEKRQFCNGKITT